MASTARYISLLLAMAGTAAFALAQLPTGTILGDVKDPAGAVVPNTTLTVRNTETGVSRTATSGADGAYRFAALPVGAYEVRATSPGFRRKCALE